MVEFYYNVNDKYITVMKDGETMLHTGSDQSVFEFCEWCKKYMDKRQWYDIEYKVFIRIH